MGSADLRKVLILGNRGMLGGELSRVLPGWFQVSGADLPECDIRSQEAVKKVLDNRRPEVVINAAAFTDVDGCETRRAWAREVNATAPGKVARACRRKGIFLVQISTDYVFAGRARRPYSERSRPSPLNHYGWTKLMGEEAVRKGTRDFLIVRTSWLFGQGGENFADTILKKSALSDRIEVVKDQVGCPTWTRHLAGAIGKLILLGASGTMNVTNTGWCSWYDYARFIVAAAGLPTRVVPIASRETFRPAPRPVFSALNPEKFRKLTGGTLPTWKQAVQEYLDFKKTAMPEIYSSRPTRRQK